MRFPGLPALALALAGCGGPPPPPPAAPPPYAVAVHPGAAVEVVATCGEELPGGRRLPGVPDGIALAAKDGRGALWVNHEWPKGTGAPEGPLASGARITEISLEGGRPVSGRAAIREVWLGEPAAKAEAGKVALGKLCSSSYAGPREGFDPPMVLTGEESQGRDTCDGRGGQAFALADGALFALPALGRAPWENVVVLPAPGTTTVVVGFEDPPATGDGFHAELYLYVGTKDPAGADPAARNGLRGGKLFVFVPSDRSLSSEGAVREKGRAVPGTWAPLDASLSDDRLDAAAVAAGAFRFVRIEDGAADPSRPGAFYFATTGRPGTPNPLGRIWKLEVDPKDPLAGGTIAIVLDGSEGIVSPDNVDVNAHGELAICEDPVPRLASLGLARDTSLWIYEIPTARLTRVAEVSRAAATAHWLASAPESRVLDRSADAAGGWEISGVVDAEAAFGRGAWIFDVQAHSLQSRDPALLQGGQILRVTWKP